MNKKILFLILLFLLIHPRVTLADQYKFYEAEYIPNIYINKYEYSTNTIYYQQARFFRNQKTEEEVYCIEPFNFFNEHSMYETTLTPRNLSNEQINRIKKIAYFGYKYNNHTDPSWYAITQLMIWKAAFPNSGDYYFTNTLNGNRVNYYDSQVQEIEDLISNYNNQLSINNKTITLVEDHSKVLQENQELNNYYTENEEIELNSNSIIIKPLKEGFYPVIILNSTSREKESLIYQSERSQNMIIRGELEPEPSKFNINVIKTKLTIVKEDIDNTISQGEASLDGTIFNIYDENNNIIDELEITNGKSEIENLDFGKYYLKEKKPGNGYQINNEIFPFEITKNKTTVTITVKNKVIEKKIKIKKTYGEENNYLPEANISFEIFDINNNLVTTITTNEEGEAEITLPYGKYTIIQKNTTEGYQLNDNITVIVNNTDDELKNIIDYKINVPNTYKTKSFLSLLIQFIKNLFKKPIKTNSIIFKNIKKAGVINYINIEKPIGKLTINKINLKQYLYNINSKNNNVDKNVTILNGSIMPDNNNSIMYIAAHSGNNKVSFFNDLDELDINDEIILEFQNKNYLYQVINKYEIKKDGTIYGQRSNKKQLVLTTCCPNKPNCQLIINCIEKTDN